MDRGALWAIAMESQRVTQLKQLSTTNSNSMIKDIYIYICVCVCVYEHSDEAIHRLISDRVSSSGNFVLLDTQKLSEFYILGIFMETSSCRHDQSLTPLSAILPSQENGGVDLKTSSLHHGLVFLGASPHQGGIQGPTQRHIMRRKDS